MANIYEDRVYDTSGARQKIITDFTLLSYTKRVNAPGIVRIGVAGDHSLLSIMQDKWQHEIWRKPEGQTWVREIAGISRLDQWTFQGVSKYVGVLPGIMSMLSWRHVMWYAETANRSLFTGAKGETIMKTLVEYNAAASATTGNGRLRNGAITGLTVQADGANGNTLDWPCAYDNLLETLQKLAPIAGGDFDLVKTSSTAYNFRWYTSQLGTDRSATVTFSMENGNMGDPAYESNRADEKTAAIVGGKGEGSARAIRERTGPNYNVSTNNIETFVNATNASTNAALDAAGDAKLRELQAQRTFTFKVLQTPSTLYGVHYFLGDKVSAINPFTGATYTQKVQAVTVNLLQDGTESINVEVGIVP